MLQRKEKKKDDEIMVTLMLKKDACGKKLGKNCMLVSIRE